MIKFIRAAAAIMLMTIVVITMSCRKVTSSGVVLTTYAPQDITDTTAVCGCEVTVEQGIELTEIGVCWSENKNPTIADSHLSTRNCDEPFMTTITGLKPNTLYHVRAYALRGSEYFYYGLDKTFITKDQGHGSDTDQNPVISINTDRTTIPSGETVAVTIQAHANTSTQKDIRTVKLDVVLNSENLYTDAFEVNAATYSNVFEFGLEGNEGDAFEVSATATDAAGKTATSTVTITIDAGALLLVERPFAWFRCVPGDEGIGLAEFGLEWRLNLSKAVYAVIKPVAGAKLYELTTSAYEAATTKSEKKAAFEGLTEVSQWKEFNVSGSTTQILDKVLGTFYQGEYHLIHITKGVIIPYSESHPKTEITITGMAK